MAGHTEAALSQNPLRWKALIGLALVQFIVFLDATNVNVALPSIQRDLDLSQSQLTWVVNAYLIAAGGLLLLGGRLGDLFGRRRVFVAGAALLAVSSLTAALSTSSAMLITSRFAQGVGEALAAPAALSMVALLFADEGERTKALGIWGGLAGLGAASGVLLSGVLTDLASWHWIFYIGVPPCVISLVMTLKLVPESKETSGGRPSWLSGVLLTGGMIAVVHGLLSGIAHPWSGFKVLGPLVGGVLALAVFALLQLRSATPLIPLQFFTSRTRLTGYAGQAFMAVSTSAMFFLVVLFMQQTAHYSPLKSGLAWLPYTVLFIPGLVLSTKLMSVAGSRVLLSVGLLVIGVGIFLFSLLGSDGDFLTGLLPGMGLAAFGSGLAAPALQLSALDGVSPENAGLGSGVLTSLQQLSQSLGLSVIITIGLSHARSLAGSGTAAAKAAEEGRSLSFVIAGAVLLVGAVICYVITNRTIKPAAEAEGGATVPSAA
ncbi:MFS transporter [Streptomyces sp. NPDC001835]|uniref:MFS transporter n=1 Tax=Streptomyces sp. NPDC001835 TaxID=3154528 RepID=UPI003320BAC3